MIISRELMEEVEHCAERSTRKHVLLVLALYSEKRLVRMSAVEIAARCGLCETAVRAALAALVEGETLRVIEAASGRRAPMYRIKTLFTERDMAFDVSPVLPAVEIA